MAEHGYEEIAGIILLIFGILVTLGSFVLAQRATLNIGIGLVMSFVGFYMVIVLPHHHRSGSA